MIQKYQQCIRVYILSYKNILFNTRHNKRCEIWFMSHILWYYILCMIDYHYDIRYASNQPFINRSLAKDEMIIRACFFNFPTREIQFRVWYSYKLILMFFMRFARREVNSTLYTNMRYIRDYVSRMSSADETIPPERRSFPDRSFYGRRNNSVVISRGFKKTRPSTGDFLKPGVIPVYFISETADSRKLTTKWDVTFSREALRGPQQ